MYIVETDKMSLVIDPCADPGFFPELSSKISSIYITHCHYDHVSCMEQIKEYTGATVYSHEKEFASFRDPVKNGSYFFMDEKQFPLPDKKIRMEEEVDIGEGYKLFFLHTPGHTEGSICLFLKKDKNIKYCFSGDTLFKGSVGRTDLGGNPVRMDESLAILKEFDDSVEVFSGHGPKTTIGREKKENPFM